MILCEFRRTIFSDAAEQRAFMPGASIADIVASFDQPLEFATHGAVYFQGDGEDHIVPRENWARIKPRAGAKLFVSCVPEGGGGGNSGKQIFTIVAAIALIVLTAGIAQGGLALMAPSIFAPAAFGAGTAGASIAAAAVSVAGAAAISMLSKPPAGAPVGASLSSNQTSLGVAGVSQNQLRAYQQVPGIRGVIRVSPPPLAKPYTVIENNDQILKMIVGVCGPCEITDIKINDTNIADLPSGVLEYETREGFADDDPLTLITGCGFEENINLEMSTHRIDTDGISLIEPYTGSYPKAHILRTARNANRFRILLQFGSGLANYNSGSYVAVAFRIRIRRVGDSTWIKLPESHINASRRNPMRQEVWLNWGKDDDEDALIAEVTNESTVWARCYFQNSEWTANSYFDGGATGATDSNVRHVYRGQDHIFFHLDEDTFPIGQYDVEITRSFADAYSNYTDTSYTTGMFTYRSFVDPVHRIPSQSDIAHNCSIASYTTFRDEYPIVQRGMALIAISARNLQVNSLSAVFGSYVDGVVTSNPAVLLKDVWTGDLNARAQESSVIDDLSDWETYCDDNGLTCNHVVSEGSVDQIGDLISACGDAVVRRSDVWGVVIDKDRSDEPVTGSFQPGNMTEPLTVRKKFLTGARALVPNYIDEDADYVNTEFPGPVFDDGVSSTSTTLIESVTYEGLTTEALARRRAQLDMRRARLRTLHYSWGTDIAHVKHKKGSLVGLQHDILIDYVATGRVKSFQASAGDLISVTLNTDLPDLETLAYDSVWDVTDMWAIGNVWDLTGYQNGMQIELEDSSIVTIPIASVDGRTLIVDGTVALPSTLKKGCLVAVGPVEREARRVIITDITPRKDFKARIEAIDAAPAIFAGL